MYDVGMTGSDRIPVTVLTGFLGAAHVAWGADGVAQPPRWAAADEHGRVLIGQL